MGKSYRIRTTPGQDKNIVLQVDQDFEQLEILSLKIRQQDVYDRMCSDYGILTGRVFANNGYGIPNAKVSIFIPVSEEDSNNPVISSIYPYKTIEQTNEDGYRFNLLPYLPSYQGHVPTGTFPSRLDSVVNQTAIEIYDKYYKYTVTTNDSGDYMIFGVPLGTQTVVMNVDLSDIGQFSLSPQDLIRMGIATEDDFDGVKFRSSPNFYDLPQIVVINKTLDILPFWGEPETCRIGITRTDFDITAEANIDIQPTAVFMGSIMSTNEKSSLRANGSSQKETGDLCKLITGPGEILGISQTILQDERGLPILQRTNLPNGGKLIDANGTWLFELPMNRDYVYTNEFGEQIISDDPKIGIPTKAKCRFKIKWQQSKNLNEDYKVGYFLVPNIRERGWDTGDIDPNSLSKTDPLWLDFQRSYGFSLDWSGYTANSDISLTNRDIKNAIDCEDTFYEFDYNKVYTVAGLVDNYKITQASSSLIQNLFFNVNHRERFLGVKRIEDDTCEDTTNRYPVNDAVFRATLIWRVFDFIIGLIGIIGVPILVTYSLIAFLWRWLKVPFLSLLLLWVGRQAVQAGLGIYYATIGTPPWWGGLVKFSIELIVWLSFGYVIVKNFKLLLDIKLGPLKFPMITYPDCSNCQCDGDQDLVGEQKISVTPESANGVQMPLQSVLFEYATDYDGNKSIWDSVTICGQKLDETDAIFMSLLLLGTDYDKKIKSKGYQVPQWYFERPGSRKWYFTNSLPLSEIINLYNAKSNYFNQNDAVNSIGVSVEPELNTNTTIHTDNVLVFITQTPDLFTTGSLFSFVNPSNSKDINDISGLTNSAETRGITGMTINSGSTTVRYANSNAPDQPNLSVPYNLPTSAITDDLVYSYKSDVEYFQVITGITFPDFIKLVPNTPLDKSLGNILKNKSSNLGIIFENNVCCDIGNTNVKGWNVEYVDIPYSGSISSEYYVVFLMRGVDPYSPKYETEISLDRILGYNTSYSSGRNSWNNKIKTKLRLNIPVQNPSSGTNYMIPVHDTFTNNALQDSLSGQYLFYPSYFFRPNQTNFTAYTTTLHRYYSALDATKFGYVVDTNFPNQTSFGSVAISANTNNTVNVYALNLSCGVLGPVKNAFYLNTTGSNHDKYNNNDSVDGVSFMYRKTFNPSNNCGIIDTQDIDTCSGWGEQTYYSFIYPSTISAITMSDSERIVMRTDRLPSSDSFVGFQTGNTYNPLSPAIGENATMWQQNLAFAAYQISEDGVIEIKGSVRIPNYGEGTFISGSNQYYGSLFSTFDCNGMVDLNCYTGNGVNFGVDRTCTKKDIVENGCYVFVKEPLIGLFKPKGNTDLSNWSEYITRYRFFYGLCQGVFSTVFINNWVNGNLFTFSFKVDTFYNSLNEVYKRAYPKDVVVLQEDSNNFYYRSSPGYYLTPQSTEFSFVGSVGGDVEDGRNERNLKYPTTILNLGPKNDILKFVTMNSNFDGYNVDQLPQTTYSDLSDMINFFSIIRIISFNFWSGGGRNKLAELFSRGNFVRSGRVDADFAQSASINSELGVIPFDSEYYDSQGPNPSLIAVTGNTNELMMGVYFYSPAEDIQVRDYISPMRKIRFKKTTSQFFYQDLEEKSQIVPFYKWNIAKGPTIFGTQMNNWNTSMSAIKSFRYQDLNRIIDPYFRDGDLASDYNYRGYIHAYSTSPTTQTSNTPSLVNNRSYTILEYYSGDSFTNVGAPNNNVGTTFKYTGGTPTWSNGSKLYYPGEFKLSQPPTGEKDVLVGSPWHFYFGVKKGATAINRFFTKYLGIEEFDGK